MAGHTASWLMSLGPQWLVIISLIQRKHRNEYYSTVTKLLGDDAIDRLLKKPGEGQDGIVFESPYFRSLRSNEILRERNGSLWRGL